MSKEINCKLKAQCSLENLRRALLKIMPDWEKYLLMDEAGGLAQYGYQGDVRHETGYSIIIPGPQHKLPNGKNASYPADRSSDNDWGFVLAAGSGDSSQWKFTAAEFNQHKAKQLENDVSVEIAKLQTHQLHAELGYQDEELVVGDEIYIDALVPIEDIPQSELA